MVRQIIPAVVQLQGTHCRPRGGDLVRLPGVRQGLQQAALSDRPHADAFRGAQLCLLDLQQSVQNERRADEARPVQARIARLREGRRPDRGGLQLF